jgi:hypothetical protein
LSIVLCLAACSGPPKAEPVRAELARRQKAIGLTIARFNFDTVYTVNFADRAGVAEGRLPVVAGPASISPSGKQIAIYTWHDQHWQPSPQIRRVPHDVQYHAVAIVGRDGSNRRDYAGISSSEGMCWSPNETKLVIGNRATLAILNLDSGSLHEIDGRAARAMSQCWSPNGKQLVYWVGDDIRMYNVDQDKTHSIAKGTQPTWSPDGNSIAFLDHDTYFTVRPDGGQPKPLFEAKGALSGLWWSPDSGIVAYLTTEPLFGRAPWITDVQPARLRVRRLSDGSDDWVDDIVYTYNLNYQWIALPGAGSRH